MSYFCLCCGKLVRAVFVNDELRCPVCHAEMPEQEKNKTVAEADR